MDSPVMPSAKDHAYIRTIRTRMLLPILTFATATVLSALVGAVMVGRGVLHDATVAAEAVARAAGSTIRDDANPLAVLPAGAEYLFLDQRGTVVHASSWYPKGNTLQNRALMTEVLSTKRGGIVLDGPDGRSWVFGYTQFRDGVAGYAVIGMPVVTAFAGARAAFAGYALLGIIGFAAALWGAIVLADFLLVRRIHVLAGAMSAIAAGDVSPMASEGLLHGLGELDEVTDMFGAVSNRFRKTLENTEQTVHSRTAELEFNRDMAEMERARFQALLTSVGDGLLAFDNDGKLMFMNGAAQRMIQYTERDFGANPVVRVLQMVDADGKAIPLERRPAETALHSKQTVVTPGLPKPYQYMRKDGTLFPTQVTVTPILVEGKVLGAIQAFHDITPEMELDRRKSEFVSIASHQLRSPISAMRWLTDMLRKGDGGKLLPPQQTLADQLYTASERMAELVEELLNVSRMEAGKVSVRPESVDVTALVGTACDAAMPLFAQKKQSVNRQFGASVTVTVDKKLVHEVVANFLSNASKYSPEGSTIDVGIAPADGMVRVSVRDRGMGIPEKEQEHMFTKFFRASNAAQSVVSGTGLGLYVCKAIVELHGGTIGFTPADGGGTEFWFTLPLKNDSLKAEEVALT